MLNRLDIEKYVKQLNAILKRCDAAVQQIPVAKMAQFKFLKVHRNLLVENLKQQAKSSSTKPLQQTDVVAKLKSKDVIDTIRKDLRAIYRVHAVDMKELDSKIQAALKDYPLEVKKETQLEAAKVIIEKIKKILISKPFEIQIIDIKEVDTVILEALAITPKNNKAAAESVKNALMKAFNIVDDKENANELNQIIQSALRDAAKIILADLQSLKGYDAMVAELSVPIERLVQEDYYLAAFFSEKLKTKTTLGGILPGEDLLNLYKGFKQPVYGDVYKEAPKIWHLFSKAMWERWYETRGELRGLVLRDYIRLTCDILNRPNHLKWDEIKGYAEIIGKFCSETTDAMVTERVAAIKKYVEFTQYLLNKYKDNKDIVEICKLAAKEMETEENRKLLPDALFWNKMRSTPPILAEFEVWEAEYNKKAGVSNSSASPAERKDQKDITKGNALDKKNGNADTNNNHAKGSDNTGNGSGTGPVVQADNNKPPFAPAYAAQTAQPKRPDPTTKPTNGPGVIIKPVSADAGKGEVIKGNSANKAVTKQ